MGKVNLIEDLIWNSFKERYYDMNCKSLKLRFNQNGKTWFWKDELEIKWNLVNSFDKEIVDNRLNMKLNAVKRFTNKSW